jgi:anaerobic selenocysteine-containing dehydrogenase
VADGEPARVSSRTGAVEAPVEVTADVRPGVVSLPHGWGHDGPASGSPWRATTPASTRTS